MTSQQPTVEQYILSDYPRTLFPLTTTQILVEQSSQELKSYLYNDLLATDAKLPGFPVQQRCYAAKRGHNLRRTVKLDPVAEYFVYDVVFRNRRSIRPDHRANRCSFGYRFESGQIESPTKAYATFREALAGAKKNHRLILKVDVATYFNSIYHHDLVNLTRSLGWAPADTDSFGRFLREINAGRSVDCLPHGMHPCKAMGSEFLRFIDNSARLKSALSIRFLDDIHVFDSDYTALVSDLVTLQELLGEKGLSLNDSKTVIGEVSDVDVPKQIDEMKKGLLQLRQDVIAASGGGAEDQSTLKDAELTHEQVGYLLHLLQTPDIEESDAELVLALLRDHADELLPKMRNLLWWYPGLTRNIYHYIRVAGDQPGLDELLLEFVGRSPNATEYQLFWIGKIVDDFLRRSVRFGDLVTGLLEHPRSTIVSRAKVLEVDDNRFGLPELRDEVLRSGRSDWEAWAAACGARAMPAAARNHQLTYFAKGSPLNAFISRCVQAMP
jgi:hypothetical protein